MQGAAGELQCAADTAQALRMAADTYLAPLNGGHLQRFERAA